MRETTKRSGIRFYSWWVFQYFDWLSSSEWITTQALQAWVNQCREVKTQNIILFTLDYHTQIFFLINWASHAIKRNPRWRLFTWVFLALKSTLKLESGASTWLFCSELPSSALWKAERWRNWVTRSPQLREWRQQRSQESHVLSHKSRHR